MKKMKPEKESSKQTTMNNKIIGETITKMEGDRSQQLGLAVEILIKTMKMTMITDTST